MNFGSKYVYLGNEKEDEEYVKVSEETGVILSDSEDSDDDGETCLLDILDTAGQEEYSSLKDMYVKDGSGFAIIYSIVDKQSFEEAEAIFNWLQRVRSDNPSYQVLIANKQDLAGTSDVQVTSKQGRDLAEKLNIPFFETSAKTGDGVNGAFTGLIKIIPRVRTDYKIVMLGSGAVGKSSVTLRFVSDTFLNDYDPTIEDSFRKMIKVPGIPPLSADQKKALKLKKKKTMGKRKDSRPRSNRGVGGFPRLFGSLKSAGRATPPPPPPPPPAAEHSSQQRIKKQKRDGNVLLISLRTLEEVPCLVTGDPIKCSKCQAILTSTGKLVVENETKSWTCEFCGNINSNLDISEDEIPTGESFDYMLCPATQPKEKQETEGEASQETKTEGEASQGKKTTGVIVYCMDISSSMASCCHIPDSHVAWRQERTRGAESISNVTKLNCIQKAVERLAEQLKLEQPEKQVLLCVFSSDVYIKAGGREDDLPWFNQLESKRFQELLDMGLNMSNDYPLKPISESHEAIDAAVKGLKETGCTALGPALAICTGFVSKIPSSEIVLCTDGIPNVGIGNLGPGGRRVGEGFYTQIGDYARQKNITINILAVEGHDVGLQKVSKAAELSGGTTNKLNPMELVRQLRLIAQNEVVATSVTVRLFLHPNFVFDEDGYGDNLSQLEKEVGSVRQETDMTFKYKLKDASVKSIDSVPFQVQITYTRPDGMQCLRVLSKASQTTSNREEMEKNINVPVLSVAAMKTTSKMAQEGKGMEAQHMLKSYKRMVDRGAVTTSQKEERLAFRNEVQQWDDQLTDNNADFATNGALGDAASNAVQRVQITSLLRCAPRMERAEKRKPMGLKSKLAYYAYRDDH